MTQETQGGSSDAARLLGLINTSWMTQAVYAAAALGIADLLSGGARTADEVARDAEADAGAVGRLLRALVTLGICVEVGERGFALTEMGKLLGKDAEGSLRAWALWWGGYLWPVWGNLLYSVRTGQSARRRMTGSDGIGVLERDPNAAEVFHRAMGELTRVEAEEVVQAYSFAEAKTIVDVGGGRGELLGLILKHYPAASGVLFDRAHAIKEGHHYLEAIGIADRCALAAGDFFEAVPGGGDVYLLKSVIHDWDDEKSSLILASCRKAMEVGAKLLVVERMLPERMSESARDRAAAQSDLHMLIGPGGKERTAAELREMVERAGFEVRRVLAAGVVSVLESVAQ